MTKPMLKSGPYVLKGLILVVLLMAVDQLSKWWILEGLDLPSRRSVPLLPFLSLTMVWNTGISMGLSLGDALGKWGIIIMTAGVSLWLTLWLARTQRQLEAFALSLIISGALGNLIDRFVHGAVVDFIHLHAFGYNFYVFNIADSAITIGVAILLIDSLRDSRKSPKNASNTSDPETDRQGDNQ